MLQMRVYKEIANVEAKVMWGLGWRQLAAAACMLVLGGGEAALSWSLGLTDLGSYLLFVVCLPFALWGWWRPKGLKPERYLGYMLRQRFGPKVYPLEPHVPARFPGKPSLKEKTRRRIGGRKARRHV